MAKTMKATIELGGKLDGSLLKTMSSAEKRMAMLKRTSSGLKRALAVGAAAAGAAVAAASAVAVKEIGECIDKGAAYEKQFAKTATLLSDGTDLSAYSEQILAMSDKTGIAAGDLTETVYQAISASVDQADAIEFAGQAASLAAGGFTDSATAVDVMTTALNAYGKESGLTAETVSDLLVTTQNLGKTSVNELAQYMGKVIPIANASHVSMQNLSAAYAIMTKNGIQTADSTTYLKGLINELGKEGSTVSDILMEQTGKSFSQLQSEGGTLFDAISILNDAVGGNEDAFKNLWAKTTSQTAALTLLNAGSEEYANTLKAMNESSGTAAKAAGTMGDTYTKQITKLNNLFENMKIRIGEKILPALTQALEDNLPFITEKMQDVAVVLGDFFETVVPKAVDAVGPALEGLKGFIDEGLPVVLESISAGIDGIGDAASYLSEHQSELQMAGIAIGVVAGGFVAINAVSGIAGTVTAVGTALGVVGATGTAAGAGLTATGGGARTAGAAAAGSVGQLLALGGAVLMIGGGVALAALGLGIMAQGAIALASAGGGAIGVMVGMVAGLFALGAAAYFAGPAFTAGAPGILAFGAAVLMVGGGVALATSGIAALAAQLPLIATFGMASGAGLMALGAGLMLAGAGGLIAGAGLLVATPALAAFSAVAAPASVGIGLLSAAVGALAGPIVESGDAVGTMGWGMQAMADNATAAATGLTTLSAASAAASAPIALSAPSMSALGTAAASSVSGTQAASAGLNAMMLVMMMLPGAVGAGVGAFSSFAGGVSSAMQSAKSSVSSACSAMQREVNGMNLSIPTVKVNALPHFSMSGEFNAETKSVPTVSVSYYAQGGFTDGPVAIAGEAGQEAVISFDPRYRDQNIMYWLMAGQMLGMLNPFAQGGFTDGTATPLSIEIASSTGSLATAASATGTGSSSGSSVDFGGVTFAPQITVSGQGGQDVISQLRQAQDEFRDMLEEIADDWRRDYAPVF